MFVAFLVLSFGVFEFEIQTSISEIQYTKNKLCLEDKKILHQLNSYLQICQKQKMDPKPDL